MTATNGTALAPLEGVVASVNAKGLKLEGQADWLNYSKFAQPQDIPAVVAGTPVLVSLDKSGFVRQLVPLGTAPAPAQHAATAPSVAPSTGQHVAPDVKDQRITRMASINAANAYLQHNQHGYSVDELLNVAATIEAWVLR